RPAPAPRESLVPAHLVQVARTERDSVRREPRRLRSVLNDRPTIRRDDTLVVPRRGDEHPGAVVAQEASDRGVDPSQSASQQPRVLGLGAGRLRGHAHDRRLHAERQGLRVPGALQAAAPRAVTPFPEPGLPVTGRSWQSYDSVAGEYDRAWHPSFEPVARDLL